MTKNLEHREKLITAIQNEKSFEKQWPAAKTYDSL